MHSHIYFFYFKSRLLIFVVYVSYLSCIIFRWLVWTVSDFTLLTEYLKKKVLWFIKQLNKENQFLTAVYSKRWLTEVKPATTNPVKYPKFCNFAVYTIFSDFVAPSLALLASLCDGSLIFMACRWLAPRRYVCEMGACTQSEPERRNSGLKSPCGSWRGEKSQGCS